MRWSVATLQYAMQLTLQAGGERAIDKLNQTGLYQLPSGKTVKMRRFKFKFDTGSSSKLTNHCVSSNLEWKKSF